jgi:hypothetical protein
MYEYCGPTVGKAVEKLAKSTVSEGKIIAEAIAVDFF